MNIISTTMFFFILTLCPCLAYFSSLTKSATVTTEPFSNQNEHKTPIQNSVETSGDTPE